MRRWTEQRWLIDNIIQANGVDWDQPRLGNLASVLGPESAGDIAGLRSNIKKYADIAPAFASVAARRETKAKDAEIAGRRVTARDNYFMAANHWAGAQWPIDSNNEQNRFYNARKRECYEKYAALADHHVEAVWVPFLGRALPAWFHLPPGYTDGKIPAVVSIPGMDASKERNVALYGDRWLSRGFAVLAIEGPGQYESPLLDIYVSMPSWQAAGPAVMNWISQRPEVDANRIGLNGSSFGSLFATVMAASEPRFAACTVASTCLEPGCHTIFEQGCPTFKKRFMYMSGHSDEDEFDGFAKSLTWEGHADNIKMPYLCVAGEADELAPIETAEALIAVLPGPKQLVIYQDCRHSVGNVPSTNNGPSPFGFAADWMVERLEGKFFESERWFVEASGNIRKTSLARAVL